MAQPTPYERSFSFTNAQEDDPDKPLPGTRLDIELDNIAESSKALTAVVNASQTVIDNMDSVVTVAENVDNVVFAAQNIATYREANENFDDIQTANSLFLGAASIDPTTGHNGVPLTLGATYYNTVTNKVMYWTGALWVVGASAAVSVRFDVAQALTGPEKTQALTNIGAQPAGGYVRYDAAQSLAQANQDFARGNISAMGRLSGGRVTSGSSLTIDLSAYLTAGIRRFRLGINRFRPAGSTRRNLSLSVRNTSNAWVVTGYANAGIIANTTDYEAWGQSDAAITILSAMSDVGPVAHGMYDIEVNNSDGVFTLQSNATLSWFVATAPSVEIVAGAVTANVNAIRLDTDGTYAVLDWTLYGVQR